MISLGALRRDFQLPVAHEVKPKAVYKAPLAAAIKSMHDLGACRDEITGYNTGISLLLSTNKSTFKFPNRTLRDKTNGLTSLSTDGVAAQTSTLDQAGD